LEPCLRKVTKSGPCATWGFAPYNEDMDTNYMIKVQSMIECQTKLELKSNLFVSLVHSNQIKVKRSWWCHLCVTDDNQRRIDVVIVRIHSLRALDHQHRDLHPIKLSYLTDDHASPSINCYQDSGCLWGIILPIEGEEREMRDDLDNTSDIRLPVHPENPCNHKQGRPTKTSFCLTRLNGSNTISRSLYVPIFKLHSINIAI
jgi:hypothetical protein